MKKSIDYTGQKILVTGGTRGIGKKLVEDFTKLGGDVFYTGTKKGVTFRHLQADFLDPDFDEKTFFTKVKAMSFDVCVNNAGTNVIGPIWSYPKKDWDKIIHLNLTIPFQITQDLSEGMVVRGYGRIVNITSISSEISMPLRSAYCSSKFGLLGLTKVSAVEMAKHGVIINAVGPGVTETELTKSILGPEKMKEFADRIPARRLANVDDISNVVMFVASSLNTYMVGQNVIVDGGYTCV